MTPQEIVNEALKLSLEAQREVLQMLAQAVGEMANGELSEAEIAERLFAAGAISEIPPDWSVPDEDFEPIAVTGKPLSETILEDRN